MPPSFTCRNFCLHAHTQHLKRGVTHAAQGIKNSAVVCDRRIRAHSALLDNRETISKRLLSITTERHRTLAAREYLHVRIYKSSIGLYLDTFLERTYIGAYVSVKTLRGCVPVHTDPRLDIPGASYIGC